MSISYQLGQKAALIKLGYREPEDHQIFHNDALEDAQYGTQGDSTVGHLKSIGLGGLGGGAMGYGAGHLMGNGPKGALIGALLGGTAGGVAKNVKNRGVRREMEPHTAPFDTKLKGIRDNRMSELKPHHEQLDEIDDALMDVDNFDHFDDYVMADRSGQVPSYLRPLWEKDQGVQNAIRPINQKYDEEEAPVSSARSQAYAPFGKKLRGAF